MYEAADAIDVLHVDDDPAFADLVATFLEREGDRFAVETATDPTDALDRLDGVDCVVSDYDMPERDGISFLEAVRAERPDLPFILYTGKGSEDIAGEAISAGVTDYLQKEQGTGQYTVLANRIENAVDNHRARRALADRERRLGLFFEQSPFGVIEWDADFEFVRQNDAAERILGYTEADLAGESWERIVPEADRGDVSDVVAGLLDDRDGYRSVNENVRADGERIVCEWHNRVVTGDDGDVVAIFSQFRDVTDRRKQKRRLDAVFNNTYTFSGLLQPDGTVVKANETVLSFGGLSREDVVGARLWEIDLVRPADEAAVRRAVERASEGELVREELRIRGADREAVIDFSVRPVTDERGVVTLLIPEGREITERKRKEKRLKRQNERLNELAGVISHDLRSPLNVAQGRLALVREGDGVDGADEHLGKAARAVDRSIELIEDLLALTREGRRVDDPEPIDLARAVERCWDTVATPEATLSVAVDGTIEADGSRLEQLLENLVRNAVDHGGPGVTVRVGNVDGGPGFYVADDGPGLSPDDRADAFEAGYTTAADGTGMGLSIAREIAEAHGWEIRAAESEAGGARFEVTGVVAAEDAAEP